MDDFGYVSDYIDVDPVFGTMDDLDRLVAAAHARGVRVLLDWVPNHTSDQHPWFRASRSSRDDPRRDWYVWRDPRPDGGPPSNWLRYVGDSAWRWDEATGQFYYRVFLDSQPDLNWRNPAVQEAMFDTLRFWLARGIDGFRIDALVVLVEDDQLRDNPPNPGYRPGRDLPDMRELSVWNVNRPETRELAARMRKVVDELGDDRVLLAELGLPLEQIVAYHGDSDGIQPIARLVPGRGRDPQRTPMPWDGDPGRRVHHRPALAARRRRQPGPERGRPARRPGVHAHPPPPPAPAPPPDPGPGHRRLPPGRGRWRRPRLRPRRPRRPLAGRPQPRPLPGAPGRPRPVARRPGGAVHAPGPRRPAGRRVAGAGG
jgi:hypothetical protein